MSEGHLYTGGRNEASVEEQRDNLYPNALFSKIDRKIRELEVAIQFCESQLAHDKLKLLELRKVRKLVTPKDEAKIRALREVGLL